MEAQVNANPAPSNADRLAPHRFTPSNAVQAQQKSALARKLNALQTKLEHERDRHEQEMATQLDSVSGRANQIWQGMGFLTKKIAQARSPKTLYELAKVHRMLREDWQVLSGTPSPGQLKQGKPRKPSPAQFSPVQPVAPVSAPDQPEQPDSDQS